MMCHVARLYTVGSCVPRGTVDSAFFDFCINMLAFHGRVWYNNRKGEKSTAKARILRRNANAHCKKGKIPKGCLFV